MRKKFEVKFKAKWIFFLFFGGILLWISGAYGAGITSDKLKIKSLNKSSQIEVGGPYVGVELHNSQVQPNRITFYYPVSNSIDLSQNYWKRWEYPVMKMGLKIENQPKESLGNGPYEYELTPYSVIFKKSDDEKKISVSYEFCKNRPAMVVKIGLTNNSKKTKTFEFYTGLETSIKTSHTYSFKNTAWTAVEDKGETIYTYHEGKETGNAVVFVTNAGISPESFSSEAKSLNDWWREDINHPNERIINSAKPERPAAIFTYRKTLAPNETFFVTQIIGAARKGEEKEMVAYLKAYAPAIGGMSRTMSIKTAKAMPGSRLWRDKQNYEKEVSSYEESVLNKIQQMGIIASGTSFLDDSIQWAKLIMASHNRYIDGYFLPMPCPAQYNYFFSHDALVASLASAFFDTASVKKILEFLIEHASKNKIIPHAYYWKDTQFLTEYTGADGWNNFWFILSAARYLRHTGDIKTIERLHPFLEKSVKQFLTNKKENLIWAYRPDWWDIGKSFGPRTYMTILAIRSLQEFAYIETMLEKNGWEIADYEHISVELERALIQKLWDRDMKYLINYNEQGTKKDPHYYTGSLLAVHFNLLDKSKEAELIASATKKLVDENVGVYNVYPMDFSDLKSFFQFSGNEAGEPFYYMNGGIWPQGNAWYALALISAGKSKQASAFIKKTMTLEGIMNGPNGQPAMYEVRNANKKDSSVYGKVDKPQFLWAASWYLYTVYHFLGLEENPWNISFSPGAETEGALYTVALNGKSIPVTVKGTGSYIKEIKYDGQNIPSAVVPLKAPQKNIEIFLGQPLSPYVSKTDALLLSSAYTTARKELRLKLRAFKGHSNKTILISPQKPNIVTLNKKVLKNDWIAEEKDGIFKIIVSFMHELETDELVLLF
ncbi:MAG: hypothetical protein L6420_10675 [Elusimicrobia bacterium]|nr:hypothetical protein [Elusimicrobiota bacterium]